MLKSFIDLLFVLLFLGGCFFPEPPTPLQNTHWNLVELMGEDVSKAGNQPEPHLFFHINDKSLHGSDGCNQLRAEYTRDEEHFSFTAIVSTQIRCPEGMDQARTFLNILTKTDRIEIEEEELIFYHADEEVARFEAL
jgi:heat shock protein HslJ